MRKEDFNSDALDGYKEVKAYLYVGGFIATPNLLMATAKFFK